MERHCTPPSHSTPSDNSIGGPGAVLERATRKQRAAIGRSAGESCCATTLLPVDRVLPCEHQGAGCAVETSTAVKFGASDPSRCSTPTASLGDKVIERVRR